MTNRPVVLCVLDGWGYRPETADNAIALADTPNWDRLWAAGPRALLQASEEEVGLPKGQMGNSEVGHMNLGAGRVVFQDLPMIDKAIIDGEFPRNPALLDLIAKLKASGGRAHILGLLSPGGVHSHQDHLVALAATLAAAGVPVVIHAFTDGRDVAPQSAGEQLRRFVADIAPLPGVAVGTVIGRYYAMDRDKRWERVSRAYATLVEGKGERAAADPVSAVSQSYAEGVNDEFILPTVIGDYPGMRDGDGLVMANFRSDRAREILSALLDPAFSGFERGRVVGFAVAAGMVEYSTDLNRFLSLIFPPKQLTRVLGEVVSEAGLKQLRIAETEKYPHVTYFFNGGIEEPNKGEDRVIIPSPKDVPTYDFKPEMSAQEVTSTVVAKLKDYDLVILNFANPDMVGHTGVVSAAIKAVETIDADVKAVVEETLRLGGKLLVTADHGNCEYMRNPDGSPNTAHTTNLVHVVYVADDADGYQVKDGILADVAPTLLDMLGVAKPKEMTGASLLQRR